MYGWRWRGPRRFLKKSRLWRTPKPSGTPVTGSKPCVYLWCGRKRQRNRPSCLISPLQREVNRMFGYMSKQALDYTQSLCEKNPLTYPRTDSRYLTDDMAETTSVVLHLAARTPPFDTCAEFFLILLY